MSPQLQSVPKRDATLGSVGCGGRWGVGVGNPDQDIQSRVTSAAEQGFIQKGGRGALGYPPQSPDIPPPPKKISICLFRNVLFFIKMGLRFGPQSDFHSAEHCGCFFTLTHKHTPHTCAWGGEGGPPKLKILYESLAEWGLPTLEAVLNPRISVVWP